MNSAAGSALIAAILSGVFTMAGVLLGTRLQSRSADREQARAAAGQRDEILASLAGAVGGLEVQADLLHAKVWKLLMDRPWRCRGAGYRVRADRWMMSDSAGWKGTSKGSSAT